MPELQNQRHEAFARAIAEGNSATAAYKLAGYDVETTTAGANGHKLLKNTEIACRISELKVGAAEKAELTAAEVVRMMREDRELARSLGQAGSAVRATELLGRDYGKFADRSKDIPQRPQVVVNVDFSQLDGRQLASLASLLNAAQPEDEPQLINGKVNGAG